MQIWKVMVLAPAIVLAAACHKKDDRAAADSALSRDLNLANQVAPYDSISPTEAGNAVAPASRLTSPRPTAPRTTTTRRTPPPRRPTSSGSSGANVPTRSG